LNAFAHDKVEQYTRRENVRISGLKLDREANITTKVLDLFNHLSRMADKDKGDGSFSGNPEATLNDSLECILQSI